MKPSENEKCKECLHRTVCIAHEDLYIPDEYESILDSFGDCEYFEDKEPNDLLDKKCHGLLIELPVPIGNELWAITVDTNEINHDTLTYDVLGDFFDELDKHPEYKSRIFATREEAEEKLKEWKVKK